MINKSIFFFISILFSIALTAQIVTPNDTILFHYPYNSLKSMGITGRISKIKETKRGDVVKKYDGYVSKTKRVLDEVTMVFGDSAILIRKDFGSKRDGEYARGKSNFKIVGQRIVKMRHTDIHEALISESSYNWLSDSQLRIVHNTRDVSKTKIVEIKLNNFGAPILEYEIITQGEAMISSSLTSKTYTQEKWVNTMVVDRTKYFKKKEVKELTSYRVEYFRTDDLNNWVQAAYINTKTGKPEFIVSRDIEYIDE
jgi:hypothetical protein